MSGGGGGDNGAMAMSAKMDEQRRRDEERAAQQEAARLAEAQAQREQEDRIRAETWAREDNLRREQQAQAATAEQKKRDEEAARLGKISTGNTNRYKQYKDQGSSYLSGLGVPDTYGLLSDYQRRVDNAYGGVEEGKNFTFSGDAEWEDVVNDATGREKGKFQRQFNQQFAPGFSSGDKYFADTADDAILEAILGEQRTEAQGEIDRARLRGTIGEAGGTRAAKELGNYGTRGNAQLQSMGGGILGGYRSGLDATAAQIGQRINNYALGDVLDMANEQKRVDSQAAGYRGRMEGDIRNVVGDTQFFDINNILGKAGSAEQASNLPGTAALAGAFGTTAANDDEEKKRKAAQGLLTNTGAI